MSPPRAENWIDLGLWGSGMDENKLPPTSELAGEEFTLRFPGRLPSGGPG